MDIGDRVQIPEYTEEWMQGDRFGKVIGFAPRVKMWRVKLDKSGRERLFLDDLKVVDTA